MPAGFTDDGLPVGMELLGREFSDPELLSMGFALEKTLKLRRAPFSTPALVGGKAPVPSRIVTAIGEFTYDRPTATLTYRSDAERLRTERVTAIWIHRGDEQKPGPAVYQLFPGSGTSSPAVVTLSHIDREALRDGKLVVRVYRAQDSRVQSIKLAL